VEITPLITYTTKAWNDGFTSLSDINFHYNYLELEDEGTGVYDEPIIIPFLTGTGLVNLINNYKPHGSDYMLN